MDRKNIIDNGFYAMVQLLVTTISYAIVYVIVIKTLGRAQLGVWALIASIPNALIFFGSGVSGSMLRYFPIYAVHRQYRRMNALLMTGLTTNFVISVLLGGLFYFWRIELLEALFGISNIPALYISVFNIALLTFIVNFIGSVVLFSLDGLQLIKQRNKLLITGSILFCILSISLIQTFGLLGLLLAQFLQALFLLIAGAIRLNVTGFFKPKWLVISKHSLKLLFSYGRKLQLIALLNLLFEPTTKYFLNRFFNLNVVGSYDIVNRVSTQLRMLIIGAVQVIIPVVTKKSEQLKDITGLYEKAMRGAFLLSSISFGLLISFAFALPYFFEFSNYKTMQIMLIYLSVAYLLNISSMPAYAILVGWGKLRLILISHVIATVLNIILFSVGNVFLHTSNLLLPTFLAITISSIFIIFAFHRRYIKVVKIFAKEDLLIYGVNFLFSFACVLGANYLEHKILLLLMALLHGLVVSLLTFRNSYMMSLIRLLLTKKPVLN